MSNLGTSLFSLTEKTQNNDLAGEFRGLAYVREPKQRGTHVDTLPEGIADGISNLVAGQGLSISADSCIQFTPTYEPNIHLQDDGTGVFLNVRSDQMTVNHDLNVYGFANLSNVSCDSLASQHMSTPNFTLNGWGNMTLDCGSNFNMNGNIFINGQDITYPLQQLSNMQGDIDYSRNQIDQKVDYGTFSTMQCKIDDLERKLNALESRMSHTTTYQNVAMTGAACGGPIHIHHG